MPERGSDSKGAFYRFGNTKHRYKAGDEEGRKKAKQAAYIQEYAAEKSNERRNRRGRRHA